MHNPLNDMPTSGPEGDGWEPPVPLDAAALPPFPLDALPYWMATHCQAVSRAIQVPIDLVAPLELAAVSASIARKIVIEVKPEYQEPLNIWTVAPLESGNRKSSTVRAVVAPIRKWEALEGERRREEIAREQSRLRIKQGMLTKAEGLAAKTQDHNERLTAMADADSLASELSQELPVASPRMLAADVTAEGLVTLLTEQEGCIAIIVAEGDIFDLMGGRYSNNIPNIGHYLNSHVGDDIDVDRQGRPHQHVSHPALTQGVSPQPDVLQGLTERPGFMGRGLLFRYLYATPRSWVGVRDNHTEALSEDEKEGYERRLLALLNIPMPSTGASSHNPHVLYLNNDAHVIHAAFEDDIEPRLGEEGDLYPIQGWGSKLAGAVARLAGILHMARYGPDGMAIPVEGDTMTAAVALGRYFIPHTQAAFAAMGTDKRLTVTRRIIAWYKRLGRVQFSERDCWLGVRRQGEDAELIKKPLDLLVDYGWIRAVAPPAQDDAKKGGRPASPIYQVNPLAPMQQEQHSPKQGSEGSEGFERPYNFSRNAEQPPKETVLHLDMTSQNPQNSQNSTGKESTDDDLL